MMGLVMTEVMASRWNTENSTSSFCRLSGLESCVSITKLSAKLRLRYKTVRVRLVSKTIYCCDFH